ncbi:lachesin-like isoform X2 [Gigantopelta aegis]|nr:lachesin-like isoform X2 [Gigantopelta aegis]
MANVSVKEGKTAVLPCSVKFLGRHQVVWTDQWSTLLTFEDRRIIDDERISVERPYTEDWNMHIRSVRYSDQGIYNCQVNTSPVKIKTVDLKVFVPAKILNHQAPSNIVVREGDTVTLACNVTGIPMPTVKWLRYTLKHNRGKTEVQFCKGTNKIGMNGEVLLIYNISRHCGDAYECVADNGVPPSVSRLIVVSVEFPPSVNLPNKRIGQVWGKETILECRVTAFPQEITVWTRNRTALANTVKYRIEIYDEGDNTLTLSLRIRNLQPADFGTYVCEASNRLGKDTQKMELFDYTAYRITSPTVAKTTLQPWFNITTNIKYAPRTQFSKKNSMGKSVVGVVNDSPTPMSTQRSGQKAPGKTLSAPPISQQSGMTGLCSGSLMPICRCFRSVKYPALGPSVYVTADLPNLRTKIIV